MSIIEKMDHWEVWCDTCCHGEDFNKNDCPDWPELITWMKNEGWRSGRDDTGWHNWCPDCVDKWVEENCPWEF